MTWNVGDSVLRDTLTGVISRMAYFERITNIEINRQNIYAPQKEMPLFALPRSWKETKRK